MVPYVPRPQRGSSVKAGLFRKDEFAYNAEEDSYICPAGQRLHPYSSSLMRGLKKINYVNKLACDDCKIRSQCTGGKFRTVSRLENEAVLDRMQARLAKRPGVLDCRRETVEHPFGTIKQWMYQGAFLMRGLEKVRAEFSLTALAYNLRRVLNIVEFPRLMVALNGRPCCLIGLIHDGFDALCRMPPRKVTSSSGLFDRSDCDAPRCSPHALL
jgi:hypothetical protein